MARNGPITALAALLLIVGSQSLVLSSSDSRWGRRNFVRHNQSMRPNKSTAVCLKETDNEEIAAATAEDESSYEMQTKNPLRLLVLRLGLTEPAATSPLNYGKYDGKFSCAYCGQVLFDSTAKYDSGSGWPSFWRTDDDKAVKYKLEFDGRLECQCGRCSSHLGHVFLDGPRPENVPQELLQASPPSDPRGRTNAYLPRFCVNGASLRYTERKD